MGNLIQSGKFTSDGTEKTLQIRSDLDVMEVINYTNSGDVNNEGCVYKWQRGFAPGAAVYWLKSGQVNVLSSGGFTLVDSSANPNGSSVAITGASNVVRPIITTADTGSLSAGSIVRFDSMVASRGLAGIDFAIDTVTADTNFRIAGAMANAQGTAGTAGNYRQIKFDPMYYPPFRYILNISQATSAVVTLSVPSGYKVGQLVRFVVPDSVYGMTEINGMLGTITAVDDTLATQTITVDIDSSGFSVFAFPTSAQAANPLSFAMVVPVGMDTAQAIASSVSITSDATYNTAYIGMILGAGVSAPAGSANDVIYWNAYKSEVVNNT